MYYIIQSESFKNTKAIVDVIKAKFKSKDNALANRLCAFSINKEASLKHSNIVMSFKYNNDVLEIFEDDALTCRYTIREAKTEQELKHRTFNPTYTLTDILKQYNITL